MSNLKNLGVKIVFIVLAAVIWAFIGLAIWRGINYQPEPLNPPEAKFSVNNSEITRSEAIIITGNSFIGIAPPVIPKTQVLGVMVDERNKELIEKILFCESSNRHYLKDGSVIKGKAGEKGVAQFKKQTFYWMAGLAKRNDLRWENKEDQIWLLDWAISLGLARHWTCYKKVK